MHRLIITILLSTSYTAATPPRPAPLAAINCGCVHPSACAYVSDAGAVFALDANVVEQPDTQITMVQIPVERTADPLLFRSARVAGASGVLTYEVPLPAAHDGAATLRLMFAETQVEEAGGRVISVAVNGRLAVAELDVIATAGYGNAHSVTVAMNCTRDAVTFGEESTARAEALTVVLNRTSAAATGAVPSINALELWPGEAPLGAEERWVSNAPSSGDSAEQFAMRVWDGWAGWTLPADAKHLAPLDQWPPRDWIHHLHKAQADGDEQGVEMFNTVILHAPVWLVTAGRYFDSEGPVERIPEAAIDYGRRKIMLLEQQSMRRLQRDVLDRFRLNIAEAAFEASRAQQMEAFHQRQQQQAKQAQYQAQRRQYEQMRRQQGQRQQHGQHGQQAQAQEQQQQHEHAQEQQQEEQQQQQAREQVQEQRQQEALQEAVDQQRKQDDAAEAGRVQEEAAMAAAGDQQPSQPGQQVLPPPPPPQEEVPAQEQAQQAQEPPVQEQLSQAETEAAKEGL